MQATQGKGCAVSACRAFLLYSAYMRAAGWIAEKVRKAKELILRRSQPEPVQEEVQPEKPATLLDDALEALASISCGCIRPSASEESRSAAERIFSAYSAISPEAAISSSRLIAGEPLLGPLLSVIGSGLVLIATMVGLPYLAVALGAAALILPLKGRDFLYRHMQGSEGKDASFSIEPAGDADRTVVLISHVDSRERACSRYAKPASPFFPLLSLVLETGIAMSSLLLEILQANLIRPNLALAHTAVAAILAFIPAAAIFFWPLAHTGELQEESLAPAAVSIALAKRFHQEKAEGRSLASTRLVFASFDGSGIGCQGSRRWFGEHGKMLRNAIAINIDSIGAGETMRICCSDRSEILGDNLFRLASSLGMDIRMEKPGFLSDADDASSAQACGIPAATITAGDGGEASPEAIDMVLALLQEIIRITDSGPAAEGLASGKRKNRISRY